MTFWEIIGVLLVAGTGWLFWSSLQAREAANAAIRAACTGHALLFLDDTVGLRSMRPVRDADGRVTLKRVYGFEYSDTGNNRRHGTVTMIAAVPQEVQVDLPVPPAGETLH